MGVGVDVPSKVAIAPLFLPCWLGRRQRHVQTTPGYSRSERENQIRGEEELTAPRAVAERQLALQVGRAAIAVPAALGPDDDVGIGMPVQSHRDLNVPAKPGVAGQPSIPTLPRPPTRDPLGLGNTPRGHLPTSRD